VGGKFTIFFFYSLKQEAILVAEISKASHISQWAKISKETNARGG